MWFQNPKQLSIFAVLVAIVPIPASAIFFDPSCDKRKFLLPRKIYITHYPIPSNLQTSRVQERIRESYWKCVQEKLRTTRRNARRIYQTNILIS